MSSRKVDRIGDRICNEQGPGGTLKCRLPLKGHGSADIHIDPTTEERWRHPKVPHGIRRKRGQS